MASWVFPTITTGVTVETVGVGLTGDGSSGSKLAFDFDGLATPPSGKPLGAAATPYTLLQLGNTTSIRDTAAKILRVHQTETLLAGDLLNALWSDCYYTPANDTDNGSIGSINLDASLTGSHNTTGSAYGINLTAWHSGTGSLGALQGVLAATIMDSTGTVGYTEGLGLSVNIGAGATVTDGVYNLSMDSIILNGDVGAYYGYWAGTPTHASGTLGAYYTFFVSDHSAVNPTGANFLFYYGGGKFSVDAAGLATSTGHVLATGTALKTDTTTAHTALIQAYDVDGAGYKTFGTLTNGNTPDFTIAPPSGGTVTVQATTYKSSDASAGITQDVTTATLVGKTMTFKNGLLTGFA